MHLVSMAIRSVSGLAEQYGKVCVGGGVLVLKGVLKRATIYTFKKRNQIDVTV